MKNYDLKSLLNCIDQYHIESRLTDEERLELTQLAREGAAPEYDYKGEIDALWAAVRALQQTSNPPDEKDEWPEYVQPTGAGTAYQVGDKITFRGERHIACGVLPTILPDGRNRHERLSIPAAVFVYQHNRRI